MRELKFRAWKNIDGKLRRYVFSPFAYEYPDSDEPVFHAESGVNDIRDFMPLADIIEQYTGIKDKNGKEIYEGDVVKCGAYSGKPIVFEEGRYWLGEEPDDLFVATVRWKIEVIGNIHENPELLEGKE